MKKITVPLFTIIMSLCFSLGAMAGERFQAESLWYEITSEKNKEVAVTYEMYKSPDNYSKLNGHVDIPSVVEFNSKSYTVTAIGHEAFEKCKKLTSVNIPNSVKTIGKGAFKYCSDLISVAVPNSVETIGAAALAGTAWYQYQPNGLIYVGRVVYQYKGEMPKNTKINIEPGTVSISVSAFANCTGLVSVNFPNSLTAIGAVAFKNCTVLNNVEIPSSVTFIGDGAFTDCIGLKNITLPETLEKVGHGALAGTPWFKDQPDGLVYIGKVAYKYKGVMPANTQITIKDGSTSISGDAFAECAGLTGIEIPNSVNYIGVWAFQNCTGLASVRIPESLSAINFKTFSGCTGLTSVTIPNSVMEIGLNAFENCTELAVVNLPSSVELIEDKAFEGDTKLREINVNRNLPPMMGLDVFASVDNSIYQNAKLNVPTGASALYKSADEWSRFVNVMEKDFGGVQGVEADGVKVYAADGCIVIDGEGVVEVFTLSGQCFYRGEQRTVVVPSGMYIVRVAGKSFKVVL